MDERTWCENRLVLGLLGTALTALVAGGCTGAVGDQAGLDGSEVETAPLSSGATLSFTGQVNAKIKKSWNARFPVTPVTDGDLVLELRWTTTSADLELRIFDASGTKVAAAETRTVGRESLRYAVTAGERYTVIVKARTGKTAFTLSMALEPLATAPDQPPVCGDGTCNGAEECGTCEADCGACPSTGTPTLPPEPEPTPDPGTGPGPTSTHPTFASTGPKPGTVFTKSGWLTVTNAGAVIENMEVTGGILVKANDVTIRNCRVIGTGRDGIKMERGFSGLLMENIEIIGQFTEGQLADANQGIYGEGSWTLRGSRISGYPDGAKLHSYQVVEGNYFFGNTRTVDAKGRYAHTDGLQTTGGHDVVIRNNTFASDFRSDFAMGSNLMIQNDFAPVANYVIENNRFSGGNYTIYLNDKDTGFGPHKNIVVRNNFFIKNSWQYGPLYQTVSDVTYSGNVYDDGTTMTGTPFGL